LTRAHRVLPIKDGLVPEKQFFDIGPVRAINGNEMKATRQLHGLGQGRWLPATASRFGWKEEK
jgi:hypothetical protein